MTAAASLRVSPATLSSSMFVARLMLSGRGASPRKFVGQVLEDSAELLVGALGAALDHVADDFFPSFARQPH